MASYVTVRGSGLPWRHALDTALQSATLDTMRDSHLVLVEVRQSLLVRGDNANSKVTAELTDGVEHGETKPGSGGAAGQRGKQPMG